MGKPVLLVMMGHSDDVARYLQKKISTKTRLVLLGAKLENNATVVVMWLCKSSAMLCLWCGKSDTPITLKFPRVRFSVTLCNASIT